MKTFTCIVILFILAICAIDAVSGPQGMHLWIDGAQVDGPLETLLALLFAGGGIVIAAVVLVVVVVLLAALFAGLGVAVLGVLALVAAVVALALSPLLLPLVGIALIWMVLSRRERRERTGRYTETKV